MRYFIGSREVVNLCNYHGIKYGKQKAPKSPIYKSGICDVCESINAVKNTPQSVLPVGDYQGILMKDAEGLITISK